MKLSDELLSPPNSSLLLVGLEIGGSLRQLLVESVYHVGRDAARHVAKATGSKLEESVYLGSLSIDRNDRLGETFVEACRVGQNHPTDDGVRCCSNLRAPA